MNTVYVVSNFFSKNKIKLSYVVLLWIFFKQAGSIASESVCVCGGGGHPKNLDKRIKRQLLQIMKILIRVCVLGGDVGC